MSNDATGNMLLDALPESEAARFLQLTDRRPIKPHDLIYGAGDRISRVYFPLTGVVSLMTPSEEEDWVETATFGREGMVGIDVFLGGEALGNAQALAQVAGEAVTIDADHFRAYVDTDGKLREILFAYTQALFAQISQSVACNALHPIQQRCARWLETHDRVPGDEIGLTQEFLADMLAVQRPSVTVAAGSLQQAGLIRYTRGSITVLDRAGLEAASCGCYRYARDEYARLLPLADI